MKIYKLPQLADQNPDGEFTLGPDELSTNAVYLLYGRLLPKGSKKIAPKEGHEDIVFVLKGLVKVRCGKSTFGVGAGEAFHSSGEITLDNAGAEEAAYIIAGGRSSGVPGTAKKEPSREDVKPEEQAAAKEDEDGGFEITRDDSPEEV